MALTRDIKRNRNIILHMIMNIMLHMTINIILNVIVISNTAHNENNNEYKGAHSVVLLGGLSLQLEV